MSARAGSVASLVDCSSLSRRWLRDLLPAAALLAPVAFSDERRRHRALLHKCAIVIHSVISALHLFTWFYFLPQASDETTAHSRVSRNRHPQKQPTWKAAKSWRGEQARLFQPLICRAQTKLLISQQISSCSTVILRQAESQNTLNLETYQHRQLQAHHGNWPCYQSRDSVGLRNQSTTLEQSCSFSKTPLSVSDHR